jgi:cell wall-associated NlpC family hydrolase
VPAPRTSSTRPRTAARPVLTAREAQAVREALAVRQALAAGQTLTAAQVAALRTATAAATRTATGTAARRSTTGRPAVRRTTAARAPARRVRTKPKTTSQAKARTRAARAERSGSPWSTRLGVVAMSTLLLPALASVMLPGSDGPGRNGATDATSLALTAQTSLLEKAGRYRQLEQEVTARRTDLARARAAEKAASTQVAVQQQVVGSTAAELYRAAPSQRIPTFDLDVRDDAATSAALYRSALAERADEALDGAVVRAERATAALTAASQQVTRAQNAVAEVSGRADIVLAKVRDEVDDLSPAVTAQLATLGAVPATGEQLTRNQSATTRWQAYLNQLAAAEIEPPAASELTDLAALPAGLSPALDGSGQPIPGIAWAVIGSRPVPVLPAETVAAVSSALSQLGKPFATGTSGPDSYDCGGFTSAAWLLAGYAVPATPQAQWATGTPVPVSALQVGDLVFAPGGLDVGIYLGDGDVVGASAGTFQVGVRSIAAGSSAVRVTLAAPAQPNAALPAGGGAGICGAPLPKPGPVSPSWGGWSNGQIPGAALCELGVHSHALRCDAAASYKQMSAAYQAAFDSPLCITDSYRSYGSQVSAFLRKPTLAAVPGTSNHGWALAVDLCGGVNHSGSPQWTWMTANAGRFGFVQPDWAQPGAEKPEPWHWEYGRIS